MQKRPLQDIVSKNARPQRRSSVRSEPAPQPTHSEHTDVEEEVMIPKRNRESTFSRRSKNIEESNIPSRRITSLSQPVRATKSSGNNAWIAVVGIIALVILGLAFLLSMLFSGATITVYPKQQNDVFIDGTFIAKKEPLTGELGYNLLTFERTESDVVEATRQEETEEYATGEIVVFNEFDDNPQRLIKNTRFESPDGKIYRIRESATVPGMTTDENGKEVPGTVELTVYADEPGEDYNVGITEFSIPGFEGTARFSKFKARSKTPIEGGFSGTRLALDAGVEDSTRELLHETLIADLKAEAFSEEKKPDGFHLYETAVFIEFDALPNAEAGESQVEIREKGTLYAVLFKEDEFARHLAANTIAGYDDSQIEIQNPAELTLNVERLANEDLPWDGDTYRVGITGTANFKWIFDEDQLKVDLSGREDEALPTILSGYPSIDRAEVVLRPFWRSTFPEDIEDITVVQVLD